MFRKSIIVFETCLILALAAGCGAAKQAGTSSAAAKPAVSTAVSTAAPTAASTAAKTSAAQTTASKASAKEIALAFVFKNKTGTDLKEAYVYPTGSSDKGSNLLKEVWKNNTDSAQYLKIIVARPEADTYDISTVSTDGQTVKYEKLALKYNNTASMKEKGAISVSKDSGVTFSDADLKAAGVTAKFAAAAVDASKKTKLAFMFKNKTGKDAKAAYVYPSGATDRGENILKSTWKDNATEADYLWISIERPDADLYDIYVEFTDGSHLEYDKEDLKNNNSASMKDADGTMSLKKDDTIGSDGKPASASAKPAAAGAKIDSSTKNVILRFTFKNKTGKDAKEAYVYPAGASDKGENILKTVWKNNEKDSDYLALELKRAYAKTYTIDVLFTDGTKLTFTDLDLINNNSASMKDTSGAIFMKAVDGDPVTTADTGADASASKATTAAAGASAASGDVTLAFVFKNKTKITMKAAYIYPTGSSDKGVNILAFDYPSNETKDDYRRMVMKRAAANSYELYVEFEDGTNATYKTLDMGHKNSLSVKGKDEISPKTDKEVTFTKEEIEATLKSGSCEEKK